MASVARLTGLSSIHGRAFEICGRDFRARRLYPVFQGWAPQVISCTYAPPGERSYGNMYPEVSPGLDSGGSKRVFADYTIYKGKSAMTMKPIKPSFRLLDKGGVSLAKEGAILLEFASAIGPRQYDWMNKQSFALSVAEMGALLTLNPQDSTDFVHDPQKGKEREGLTIKKLRIAPLADARTNAQGLSFALTVSENRSQTSNIFVSVTKSEFAIMRTCITYVLPYLLGWQAFVDHTTLEPSMFEGNSQSLPQGYSNE